MSDAYEGESFESGSNKSNAADPNQAHALKLSIDCHSVRNLAVSANLFVAYQLSLSPAGQGINPLDQVHSFQSSPATAVPQGMQQDTKLTNGFCSYEFSASKQRLFSILNDKILTVRVVH